MPSEDNDPTMKDIIDVRLEQAKLKSEINVLTMAMGKFDDSLTSINQTLKEMSKSFNEVIIRLAELQSFNKRIDTVEKDIEAIKNIPSKLVFYMFSTIAVASIIGLGTFFFKH